MKYKRSSIDKTRPDVQEAQRFGAELGLRSLNMLEVLLHFYLPHHPIPPLKSKYIMMQVYRETLIQKHRLLQRYTTYGLKFFEHGFQREAFFKSFVQTWNQNKPDSTPLAGPLLKDEKKKMRKNAVHPKTVGILP